jgi:hypothetical protein
MISMAALASWEARTRQRYVANANVTKTIVIPCYDEKETRMQKMVRYNTFDSIINKTR